MSDIKGIVGEKMGMTQIFVETRAVPVTVLKAGPCVVAQIRTQETDGYDAVQLAYGSLAPRHTNKPTAGHFEKAGAEARRHLVELRTDDAGQLHARPGGHGRRVRAGRHGRRRRASRRARGSAA